MIDRVDGKVISLRNTHIAAIDVGSNSTHLVIAEVDELGHIHILESQKEQTRLGACLDENDFLDAQALIKLSRTLKRMNDLCLSYHAQVRAVGTQTLRQAKNGREFCQKLYKRSGVNVEIVTGKEEARLIYLGIQLGLEIINRDALVFDIGGGSTEILVGERGEEHYSTSLKLGCVSLTQTHFQAEEYSALEAKKLQKTVALKLKSIAPEIKKVGYDIAICSSGTVKAVKLLALGIQKKPVPDTVHGVDLTIEEIELAYQALQSALTVKQRRSLPNVDEQRADILLAGCTILREFSLQHGINTWLLSLFALREGILVDLMSRDGEWLRGNPGDIRWRSVRAFGKKLHIDELHAHRVTVLSLKFFDEFYQLHKPPEIWREYLRCASYLHEGGRFLSFSGYHKHSYYLIKSASMLGFTVSEQEIIALIARFHRKRLTKPNDDFLQNLSPTERQLIRFCAGILRLAVALDKSRSGRVRDLVCSVGQDRMDIKLKIQDDDEFALELFSFESERLALEASFGKGLRLEFGSTSNPNPSSG